MDESAVPDRARTKTGLRFVIDTNVIGDTTPAVAQLRPFHEHGWVNLTRTDVIDTELDRDEDDTRRQRHIDESGRYVEHLGPSVWGESRWGHAVWSGGDDQSRLDAVASVLYPGLARQEVIGNNLRDCMHVATAIRYGISGFITRDKRLLNKAAAMRATFNDFIVCTPEYAVGVVQRFKARAIRRGVEDTS